jgi:hypothetical protein
LAHGSQGRVEVSSQEQTRLRPAAIDLADRQGERATPSKSGPHATGVRSSWVGIGRLVTLPETLSTIAGHGHS